MSRQETVTVRLKKPVTVEGKALRELTFREPMVDDMLTAEAVGGGDLRQTVAMLASMAGVEMAVLKQVTRSDFQRIMEAVAPLLAESSTQEDQATGPDVEPEISPVASAA